MKKRFRMMLLVCVFVLALCVPAYAETSGTANIQVSGPVQAGENYQVQVVLSGDAALSDVDMFLDYTSALTEYVAGDVAETGGVGQVRLRKAQAQTTDNKTFTWTIEFQAKAEGQVNFALLNIYARNEEVQEDGSQLMSVTAQRETLDITAGTAATAGADETLQPEEPAQDALAALEQEILSESELSALVGDQKVYVRETFSNEELPLHFVEATQFYKGVEIKAAQLNNTQLFTVMVEDENGNNRAWVIYDQANTKFYTLDKVVTDTSTFVILQPPAEELIPDYFSETTLNMGLNSYQAWQTGGNYADGGQASDPNEFYLVYGYNQNGHLGWFIYDSVQSSFQRYVELTGEEMTGTAAVATDTPDEAREENEQLVSKYNFILNCAKYGGLAILALLIILLIINFVGRGKAKEESSVMIEPDSEQEPDWEHEDGYEDEVKKSRREKKAMKQAKLKEMTDEDGFVDDYNVKAGDAFDDSNEAIGALKPVHQEESQKAPAGDEQADAENKKEQPEEDELAKSLNRISEEIKKTVEQETKPKRNTESTNGDSEESITFIDLDE